VKHAVDLRITKQPPGEKWAAVVVRVVRPGLTVAEIPLAIDVVKVVLAKSD